MIFSSWQPPADVFSCANHWLVKLELAGVNPQELNISTHRNKLIVQGTRRDLLIQKGYACQTLEISYSSFKRSFAFPLDIDPDSIRSEYCNGMLQIELRTEHS